MSLRERARGGLFRPPVLPVLPCPTSVLPRISKNNQCNALPVRPSRRFEVLGQTAFLRSLSKVGQVRQVGQRPVTSGKPRALPLPFASHRAQRDTREAEIARLKAEDAGNLIEPQMSFLATARQFGRSLKTYVL
jgi:hypothetical protein